VCHEGLTAANRGIWKASELQRLFAERGLVISAGKMPGLWSGRPAPFIRRARAGQARAQAGHGSCSRDYGESPFRSEAPSAEGM
jgi:hypothetical protein